MKSSPRNLVTPMLLAAALFAAAPARAADIAALAAHNCAACHVGRGHASNPQWPHLAGQKSLYLARQLQAFRNGARKDALMSPVAAALSDADIEALSTYYSQLPDRN